MGLFKFKMRRFGLLVMVFVPTHELRAAEEVELFQISGITKNEVTYDHYTCRPLAPVTKSIDRIDVWDEAIKSGYPLQWYFLGEPDTESFLLRKGWAELSNPASVPQELRSAEEIAKKDGVGIWESKKVSGRPVSTGSSGDQEQSQDDWQSKILAFVKSVPKAAWATLGVLSLLGVPLYRIVPAIHRKYYIEKRIDMVVIGEPAAGKTGFLLRLHNPRVTSKEILSQAPSVKVSKDRLKEPIPYSGKFQIFPRSIDIPGPKYGMIIDALHGKHDVLVVVVSHNKGNGSKDLDYIYISEQLKLVHILVGGAFDSKTLKRPRAVVLFISKFELISGLPPWDSGAKASRKLIEDAFQQHVSAVDSAAKRHGIPSACFIGSSAANWNCEEVLRFIADKLYVKK